jgi:dipeptidyl aminopeptidase/acylaminoacyl peptidase
MKIKTIALLAAALAAPLAAQAQTAPLEVNWENVFKNNTGARDTAISPDGAVVAVTARTADRTGIFLVPVTGGQPKFWVEGTGAEWFPNGDRIVFSKDNDLWAVAVGSSTPTRITNDKEDERTPKLSPDGRTIAFYSGRSGHQDIWVVPAVALAKPRQLTKNSMALDDARYEPSWSPDGKTIAYFSNKTNYWHDDVWTVDVASGKESQLSKTLMAMSTPQWSPDGKRIAVLGNAKTAFWYEDLSDIYLIDVAQKTEKKVPMQIYATDLLNNLTVHWSKDGKELFFPYHERAEVEMWRVPSEGGVATRMTNMGGTFFSYDAAPNGSGFAFVRSTPTRGNEVDYFPIEGGAVRQLTDFAAKWQGLVKPEEVSYRSWDGLYIQGFLFRPPGFDPAKKYPALVMVHGGGTNSHYNRLSLQEQKLAREGYVVLAVNYRGGSGFGRVFQDLAVNDWGNGQALDAAAAGEFIRAQPWSTGKVGIYGYSYGGITTLAAISRVPDAFDAAVPMGGIYDFADAYNNADRLGKVFLASGHGGSPAERPEIYAISNSLSRVHQIKTPVLIMHGEADVRAPFRQYQLATEILKREGKVFESKSYPGEPHGFRNPENYVDMYTRLEAWFEKYLK